VIAVTFALPAESREFLRSVSNKSRDDHNGINTIRGKIDDRAVEVLHTGVGEKVCRQRIGKFLQDQQFDYLVSAGFAGALTDDLRVGDLLLAQNFSTIDLRERWSSLSTLPIHLVDILTPPAIIDSGKERMKLARASGAGAVDMETEFIARTCAKLGVPLLSLRVISDTPQHLFPAPANVLFDIERQQTHMLKLATYLLANPSRIPHLVRFAKRIARARRILATALVDVLRALPVKDSPARSS
jgi:nucleoside phosphorylase